MLFERPESGDKAVLLHVELHGKDNPDQAEFVELARSEAQIDVVHLASAKRNHRIRVGSWAVARWTISKPYCRGLVRR